ncbi:hypothetical protein OEZ86_012184 [Tetradesmus obliquus]|nr:hypothetical protein OEZ86_012184 [Tetradesmus obliquus]
MKKRNAAAALLLLLLPVALAPSIAATDSTGALQDAPLAAARIAGTTFLFMGVRQPLPYKQAQKACRAAGGALATLQDDGSPYKFTEQVLLAALSNITHVSTLQEAYTRAGLQMPTSSWQLTPNCSSSSSSSSSSSGSGVTDDSWSAVWGSQQQQQQQQQDLNPPAAPLLWWVDNHQQQQQQQQRGSSSKCNALGPVEQGVVAGLGCGTQLPFVCAVSEPEAQQYTHPDMAALK